MKKPKITEGLWTIKKEKDPDWKEEYFYLWADEKPIATIYGDNAVWLSKEEEKANAKAIKEVPNLIDIGIKILKKLQSETESVTALDQHELELVLQNAGVEL